MPAWWVEELKRAANIALSVGPAVSILLGIVTILGTLGISQTVWVTAAVGAFAVIPVAGLWLVDRGVRDRYVTQIKEEPTSGRELPHASRPNSETEETTSSIRVQVVPAFSEIGLDRTHQAFLKLISELNLSDEKKQNLTDFVERTATDAGLDDQEKIERIIFRFAPSATQGRRRAAKGVRSKRRRRA